MRRILSSIAETAALLELRGWTERNAGNISILLNSKPEIPREWIASATTPPIACPGLAEQTLIITAAGSRMRDIAHSPQDHVVILEMLDGSHARIYRPSHLQDLLPSSELPTHLRVHESLVANRPEQHALLHAHVTPLIQLSHHPGAQTEEGLNDILLRVHPETLFFLPDGSGLVPFMMPGTSHLAETTAAKFSVHDVVIWERHGALACGPDLREAFDRLDIAARAAEIFLGCKRAGFSPKTFSEEEFRNLKDYYHKPATGKTPGLH